MVVALGGSVPSPPQDGVLAVAAVLLMIAGWVFPRRRGAATPKERETWRWLSGGVIVGAAGIAVTDLFRAFGVSGNAETGIPFLIASLLACQNVYQGVLRWNRFRTLASDPGDWLNGLAATASIAAIGDLVIRWSGCRLNGWSAWHLQGWLLRCAALAVLLGTALTLSVVGNLARDLRIWMMTGAIAAIASFEVLSAVLTDSVFGGWAQVGWLVGMALFVAAAVLRPAETEATAATTASSTIGALVVLGSGVTVLFCNSLTGGRGVDAPTIYSLLSVLLASTRTGTLVRDLSQLAQSRFEARTDDLTGAANRRALTARLVDAAGHRRNACLLVWDLDRFKEVNDRYGHPVGDALLCEAVRRAQTLLPARSLLARLGGDEFAVLLEGMSTKDAVWLGQALVDVIADITEVEGRAVQVEASVGIASTGRQDNEGISDADGSELLRRADAAMYRAKRGGARVNVYDRESDATAQEAAQLLDELTVLLTSNPTGRREQLVLYYQAQQDLRTDETVAAEALIRWHHPRLGVLSPDRFLGIAEERGLMGPLTTHVLQTAAATAAGWKRQGWSLRVSVNLSASSLSDPELLPLVDRLLKEHQLPPSTLKLEITETTFMASPEQALQTTREFVARGIGVSIDDYGTGYSSLAYLNDLPATELKIDRSFTMRLTSDPRTAAIVAATIELGHRLDQRIVAEGVEDEVTREALRELGCDKMQGYLWSKPLPLEAFEAWHQTARTPALHRAG